MEMEPGQPPKGTLVRRLYGPCTFYPKFRALSESAKLLDCVQQLLGPNPVLHCSKLNMKPAAIGSVVEWHQDLAYYLLTNRDPLAVLPIPTPRKQFASLYELQEAAREEQGKQ